MIEWSILTTPYPFYKQLLLDWEMVIAQPSPRKIDMIRFSTRTSNSFHLVYESSPTL